ncbi:cell elongation-specific peptidoglycan biosynthesis regulator RodA [Candidatus Pelagibacter ubique]|uniref:Peptidoglycan glycosyltransferase MrdB n=1 Tax=Pelagibacter ubique TaxID=198252 RepID=A0ABX1T0J2_PELUQ|nr:rod shape-determining protein RodA [Candidatus Pelagibacter ubique]NMN67632.1 cell elongation-specific peptidoglycan biosynthesis regulator RodA [Candidatus Pelagibacter ubique]
MKNRSFNSQLTFFQKIRNFDYILLSCILLLGFISTLSMYSTDGGEILFHSKSHALKFLIFFIMMLFISLINIRFWYFFSYLFYIIVLLLLIWASLYGVKASGSQRWINLYFINLQPSELMKIAIIVCLAKFYHRIQVNKVNSFQSMLIGVAILILPIMLVVSQPDLGTSILIALSGLVVIWLAGINVKYFVYSFITLVISMPFVIAFLKPYQKLRILTFLNPDRDPLGAGYQIIQSKIAVGSGGLNGKGFLKGTQSYLEFLPEKHTDFIFTLFAEEHGFIGSLGLLLIYIIIIYRVLRIGTISRSYFAKLFCYGYGSAIFFYVTVNMSMVLGLLPIVGSPLPIMSYGGSSMLATMIGFAIVMSAKINHKQLIA